MASPDPETSFDQPSSHNNEEESQHSDLESENGDISPHSSASYHSSDNEDSRLVGLRDSTENNSQQFHFNNEIQHENTIYQKNSNCHTTCYQGSSHNNFCSNDYDRGKSSIVGHDNRHISSFSSYQSAIMKPDTFDGTTCFEQYLSHFEDCAELSQWDLGTRVLYLALSLRGSARIFYMNLSKIECRNYRTLVKRLSDRFGYSSKHQCLWLNKLENRCRMKGESIASLADDLLHLSRRAFSDLDQHAQERLALNQLYRLISTEMKCRCMDNNCSTVIEAVSVIERYESILGDSCSTIRSTYLGAESDQPSDLSSTLKRIEARLSKIEAMNSKRNLKSKEPKTCFGCNSLEHLWSSCPLNTNQSKKLPDSGSTSNLRSFDSSEQQDRNLQSTYNNGN